MGGLSAAANAREVDEMDTSSISRFFGSGMPSCRYQCNHVVYELPTTCNPCANFQDPSMVFAYRISLTPIRLDILGNLIFRRSQGGELPPPAGGAQVELRRAAANKY